MTPVVGPPGRTRSEQEEQVRTAMATHGLYVDDGPGLADLAAARANAKALVAAFNDSAPDDPAERARLLRAVLGSVGEDSWVEPPLRVMYGSTVHVGTGVYINVGLTLVDDVRITIGDRVLIAPHVTITTTGHPVHPDARADGSQFSAPVHIGDDVWIGSGAQIMPGLTIGRGSVVAAGAVVTRHVPEMVVVGGTPARIIRPITDADRNWSWREPARMEPEST